MPEQPDPRLEDDDIPDPSSEDDDIPDPASEDDDIPDPSSEDDDKPEWTKCFKALDQVPGYCYTQCGRLVDDPAMAIFFISS
jgi:hypothetical protein